MYARVTLAEIDASAWGSTGGELFASGASRSCTGSRATGAWSC